VPKLSAVPIRLFQPLPPQLVAGAELTTLVSAVVAAVAAAAIILLLGLAALVRVVKVMPGAQPHLPILLAVAVALARLVATGGRPTAVLVVQVFHLP
jgi:hypothetical protein